MSAVSRWVASRREAIVTPVPRTIAFCALFLAVWISPTLAATYYVDASNSNATDSGSGSSSQPFKTIQAAVTRFAAPGNTIIVRPSTYREYVSISASGTSSNPFVLQAGGSDVIVSGADDFSGTGKWSPYSGSVFVATGVTWTPLQVFADGVRLSPSTASPSSLPVNSFVYVSGTGLYVNLGGPNPGSRKLEVGRRTHVIGVSGSNVTVNGFQVMQSENYAVGVSSATGSAIQSCTVTLSNQHGIHVENSTAILLDLNTVGDNNDHGIYLNGCTSCRITRNHCYRNARPAVRAANGINVNASTSCTVEANRCHDNQDTGIQFYNGSNDCISRNNTSWNNGDHGFDHLGSSGVRHSNDVAYGNYKDGFSFEGSSPNGAVFNCIAVENGLTTNEYDLWVDATSAIGFQSDYNIFWNSTSQPPIKSGSTRYSSITSYTSATGNDPHSKQSDPRFSSPGGGDFHLSAGSPAIDCGNASAPVWPSRDAEGTARIDDPATPNTGAGNPSYSDRGAYEYSAVAADHPPIVTAPATATGTAGVQLTVNVTAADPDGDAITSLTANLSGLPAGNNASFTVNGSKTAGTLTWTPQSSDAPGPYTVTFTATNSLSGSASTAISVSKTDHAPTVTAPATVAVNENAPLTVNVTAADPDGDAITSLTANLSGLPAGNNAVFTPNGSNTAGTLTWTPTFADARATPYSVTFTATNALSGSASTAITVNNTDRAPVVTAPATVTAAEGIPVSISVSASDPDGDALTSLVANVSGLPAGNNATFTKNASNTAGTLTWTPTYSDGRAQAYTVTFTASNALSGSASTAITVRDAPPPGTELVANPGFESGLTGWSVVGRASLTRVSPGHGGTYAAQLTATNGSRSSFGITDDPNSVAYVPAAGLTYRISAWVRSPANSGSITLQVAEFVGSSPQGATASSSGRTLTPAWTQVTFDYVTRAAGSFLDVTVINSPVTGRETFQIDDVSIMQTLGVSVDQPPVVSAPSTASVSEGSQVTVNVTASDPDGQAINSLTADLSGLPSGSNAQFTTNGSHTTGTLTWTPTSADGRVAPYVVTFTATNALSGTASTSITVNDVSSGSTNLVTNPGFETDLSGWKYVGSATLTRVSPGHSGSYCVEVKAPSSGTYGITDNPNVITNVASAGMTYRFSAWVRSASSVGAGKIKVREFVGSTQQGSSAYSSGLTLSPTWKQIVFDYVTRTAGSYLDVEINDYPVTSGETFQIDDVSFTLLSTVSVPTVKGGRPSEESAQLGFAAWIETQPGVRTDLRLSVTQPGPARMVVYDVVGRRVFQPLDESFLPAGDYRIPLEYGEGSRRLGPGVYFCQIRVADGALTKRFVIVR